MTNGAAFGVGDDILHTGNGEALADARTLVNLLVLAGGEGDSFDDLANVLWDHELVAIPRRPGFLRCDGDAFFDGGRIMRADFGADAVFERSDDFSARRVVFRIRGEDQRDIERQAHGISFNLNVAFLHDVEETDLNFSREVGQFVHGEDATIGAGQKAIVHCELAGKFMATASGFDGINVADEISDGDIWSREFLDKAFFRRQICDGGGFATMGD